MIAAVCSATLVSCAAQTNDPDQTSDPIEPVNRMIFAFNDTVDLVLVQPTAFLYREALPDFAQDMVHNFVTWLRSPIVLANDLLQGDIDAAGDTSARLVVNGLTLGLFDPATDMGFQHRNEDFGQTLGVHGTGGGFDIVLPLLGPSNLRDTIGLIVDRFFDPLTYIGHVDYRPIYSISAKVTSAVDFRARNYEQINEMKFTSLDYYARVRTIYSQHRNAAIKNGEIPVDKTTPDMSREFEQFVPTSYPGDQTGDVPTAREPVN